MKTTKLIAFTFLVYSCFKISAQEKTITPDLSNVSNTDKWSLINRDLITDEAIHLNGKPGQGILWFNDLEFSNGSIELDIKGKNEQGKSFVGIAFHSVNDSTFDAVYFRPFNFKNLDRSKHLVQYISQPIYPWYKLRKENPGKYEDSLTSIPEPNHWFHVKIVIDHPNVKVYINNNAEASLEVKQLSSQKKGLIGFWVGHNSEGYFKNLQILSD